MIIIRTIYAIIKSMDLLPLNCVILDKLLKLFDLQLSICKVRVSLVHPSQGFLGH